MKRPEYPFLLFLLLAALPHVGQAATCSCAGAPLVSAMDTSATEQGDLFLSLSTEQHEISDLVRGGQQIPDETGRERSSLAHAMAFSYGLSDRWALSGLVSYIEHERNVGSSFLGKQKTSGLGDAVVMVRYTPVYITPFSRHEVSLGLGARLPVGKDDAGGLIAFSEDMQPSTGAPGAIAWASHRYAFNQAGTLSLASSAYYTHNENQNDREYLFGDEFVAGVGMAHNLTTRFSYSAGLRYRHTTADQRLRFDIPNTGGEWWDFVPAVNYSVTDSLNLGLSGRVPLDRNLDGALQFTTSYSVALSVTYGL